MKCFAGLVGNYFLKKASKELQLAQTTILRGNSASSIEPLTPVSWLFSHKEKRRQFKAIWDLFEMDQCIYEDEDFLCKDSISIVEDDNIAILCSTNKKLVNQNISYYYQVHGDWCYYRTKKRIDNLFVYIAIMWRAFPSSPFSLN